MAQIEHAVAAAFATKALPHSTALPLLLPIPHIFTVVEASQRSAVPAEFFVKPVAHATTREFEPDVQVRAEPESEPVIGLQAVPPQVVASSVQTSPNVLA